MSSKQWFPKIAASGIIAALLSSAAVAQDSFTQEMLIGGDDPTFPRNAGRHYEVLQVTVTDPDALAVTVSNTTHNGRHRFVLTPTDYVLPDANRPRNVRQIANEAEAVAWRQIRRNGTNTFRDAPSPDPLDEGQYQLFVGVNTNNDRTFTLMLSGARLGWGPSVEEEIAHLTAASSSTGRITANTAHGVARTRGQISLATRNEAISFTRVSDVETGGLAVTQSTSGLDAIPGAVYSWVEFTGFHAESDTLGREYAGWGIQVGADIALHDTTVLGFSLGAQDTSSTIGAVDQEGLLRFVQPYLAYQSGDWSGEATVIYGLGDYTQTSGGGTGTGETRLTAITFTGGYDVPVNDAFVVTPTLGLAYGMERIEGQTGTLAAAGVQTVRFSQVTIGANLAYTMNGLDLTAGLHADWLDTSSTTALVSDLMVDDGWTGRLELGLMTELQQGLMLDTTLALSGIGGDMRQSTGSIRFAIRF